jgi:hypothetical protein
MDGFFDKITPYEILAGIRDALGMNSILIQKTRFCINLAIAFP